MALLRYISGPSVLRFPNRDPIPPGTAFEYDFGPVGPHGEHGPAHEAALLACGAIISTGAPLQASDHDTQIHTETKE